MVIPAHNEARVITRCLDSLGTQAAGEQIEVVVVANGCVDETASLASAYRGLPHLQVLELARPSKAGALNAGDRVATAFPRIYLDADNTLGPGALEALIDALDVPQPRVASPRVTFRVSEASRPVRSFYRVFSQLPYVRDGLVGLGVYGMSAAGRARFEEFPEVTADDLFAQRIFVPQERVIVDAEFTVTAPRSLSSLVKVRTRVARGNTELSRQPAPRTGDFAASTGSTVAALIDLVRRQPRLLPDVAGYVAVTAYSRFRSRRATSTHWERDTSTR